MPTQLSNHFVAFIDILGFSEMVQSDCQSAPGNARFIDKLLSAHDEVLQITEEFPNTNVIQFSDSIVISVPYSKENLDTILTISKITQIKLLSRMILCRGGIAIGQHFSNKSFIFSDALIEAYRLETREARYPRIVISTEIIKLLYPYGAVENNIIVKENDGVFFVDFLLESESNDIKPIVSNLTKELNKHTPSVQEKLRWLIEYYNSKFPQQAIASASRFSYVDVPAQDLSLHTRRPVSANNYPKAGNIAESTGPTYSRPT